MTPPRVVMFVADEGLRELLTEALRRAFGEVLIEAYGAAYAAVQAIGRAPAPAVLIDVFGLQEDGTINSYSLTRYANAKDVPVVAIAKRALSPHSAHTTIEPEWPGCADLAAGAALAAAIASERRSK